MKNVENRWKLTEIGENWQNRQKSIGIIRKNEKIRKNNCKKNQKMNRKLTGHWELDAAASGFGEIGKTFEFAVVLIWKTKKNP